MVYLLSRDLFFCWDEQGAKSGGELESAQAKNQALREAGAIVPTSYEALESAIKEAFDKLVC
jgi:ATP citrate (pro-S)-lyase